MLKRAILWLRANLRRRGYEREMREEMQEHLDRAVRRLRERGLPEEEARRQARREFGEVTYHETAARDARGTLWLDDLRGDARFAIRHFARTPGTTLMMLAVLAFGLSISTVLFSFVHGLRTLPPAGVTADESLVRIRGSKAGTGDRLPRRFEEEEYVAYTQLTGQFSSVAGWIERDGVLQVPSDPERLGHQVDLTFVTGDYFRVLGVQPVLGAGLPRAADDDAASSALAVINYVAWRTLFEERRDIIGSTVTINGVPITIVGVAPKLFNGASGNGGLQVWLPLAARHVVLTSDDVHFSALGRLRPGVSAAMADAAVRTIGMRTDTVSGDRVIRDPSTEVVPLLSANDIPEFDADIGAMTIVMALLGLVVLLVTCTNVSALLTGLASARRQEIAVRLSLGAPRIRLIRQLLTESAVIALIAGLAALATVTLLIQGARALLVEFPLEIGVRWPTLAFTFAVALGVGVLFGLSPALHATRLALAGALRDSGAGIASSRARLQRVLVVAQIALTQPLIVLMTTMLVFLTTMMQTQTGSDAADRVVTLAVRTPTSIDGVVTPESERRQRELLERVQQQVRALPGVQTTVFHWEWPQWPGDYTVYRGDEARGVRDATAVELKAHYAQGPYFDVLGIPLRSGRPFGPADVAAAEAGSAMPVIIGADLARLLWGGTDPVGRRLQTTSDTATQLRTLLVVGVVEDPAARTRLSGDPYRIYFPGDSTRAHEQLLIRTAGSATPLLPAIRDAAQRLAPAAIVDAKTMAQAEDEANRVQRLVTGLLSAGGAIAMLLSAIGLYAVIAFSVVQRRQEIAVRLALGARSTQITRAFIGDAVRLGAIGLAIGLPAGLFAVRLLMTRLQLGEMPLVFITLVATGGIFMVAASSALGPARRAAGVHPAGILRGG